MSSAETPSSSDESGTPPTRPELSVTQVVASTLAAVTATFAASYFGVSGTVIGAALASIVTVVGNALYSHYIHRVRGVLPARSQTRRVSWRHAAFGAAGLFLIVAGIVTGIELAAGRPLDKIVHDKSGSGTSLFGGGHKTPAPATTTPTPTRSTPDPSPAATRTHPSSTASTSSTPTPTPTSSAPTSSTPSPTSTATPTPTPSGSVPTTSDPTSP